MKYACFICNRQFSFEDTISFCPYCGSRLSDGRQAESRDVEQMLDTLWGETSQIKQEFLQIINACIDSINHFAEHSVAQALPSESISQYEKNYRSIKSSNNRKTLIGRVQTYLDFLGRTIDDLSDSMPADTASKLESTSMQVREMTQELCNLLGVQYALPKRDELSSEKDSVQIVYRRDQLKELYRQVQYSFEKYKKCVEDNNMFAAFASDSDYGTIQYSWRSWFSNQPEDGLITEAPDPQNEYQNVMDFIISQNRQPYWGILDEDFVPHVDAFWHSLEKLCAFIDGHIAIDWDQAQLNISSDTSGKLSRMIRSYDFVVTEARLEAAMKLKEYLAHKAYNNKE